MYEILLDPSSVRENRSQAGREEEKNRISQEKNHT